MCILSDVFLTRTIYIDPRNVEATHRELRRAAWKKGNVRSQEVSRQDGVLNGMIAERIAES